ncbi:MAG: hypothetical protein ABSB35_06350 [Bryobacteraceae bacterium]|jgi:hypothetical protein
MLPLKTDKLRLLHPGWTLALPLLALTAVIASPPERRLLSVLASASVFALMQWLLPRCRFRADHYFSPVNVALLLLFLKIVIAPILVMAAGAGNDLFVAAPSRESMEGAVLIDSIAYVALCFGLAFTPQRRIERRKPSMIAVLSETPGPAFVLVFAAVGLLGFFLAFGSPGAMVDYFLNPSAVMDTSGQTEGTWSGFLGTVLRPFVAFAFVAWWARSLDFPRHAGKWWPALTGAVAAIGITIANLTFSYNRAAFVFPVIAVVAVYSARIRRISPVVTASALAVLLPVLFAIGNYREKTKVGASSPADASLFQASLRDASDQVQSYAGGPPLEGLFLDQLGWGDHLYGGSTLVASALSPFPILGKSFRESSGSTLYNRTLYGMPDFDDQIIPFSAELFVNFHAAGVLAGFLGLGLLLGRSELWFAAAGSSFGAFVVQYVSMWCAMLAVWSLSVFSQIALYFLWPIYLYWAAVQTRAWLRGMRPHSVAVSIPSLGEAP